LGRRNTGPAAKMKAPGLRAISRAQSRSANSSTFDEATSVPRRTAANVRSAAIIDDSTCCTSAMTSRHPRHTAAFDVGARESRQCNGPRLDGLGMNPNPDDTNAAAPARSYGRFDSLSSRADSIPSKPANEFCSAQWPLHDGCFRSMWTRYTNISGMAHSTRAAHPQVIVTRPPRRGGGHNMAP
jgi:hypothetical protein